MAQERPRIPVSESPDGTHAKRQRVFQIKQTDRQEAQGLNSQFKYFEFVSSLIKDEDDFNIYRQLPI